MKLIDSYMLLFLFSLNHILLLEKQQDGVNYNFSICTFCKDNFKMPCQLETKKQVEVILDSSTSYWKSKQHPTLPHQKKKNNKPNPCGKIFTSLLFQTCKFKKIACNSSMNA